MHPELAGWVPYRLERDGGRTVCRWRYVGNVPFTAPFFEDTIQRALALRENSLGPPVVTELDAIAHFAATLDGIDPTAFIFHVSRCGSTLVSQLLSEDPAFISLSEVPLVDQLLRARFSPVFAGTVEIPTYLPAVIRILGQRRTGRERFLFIKLDSWHVGLQAEIRAIFPETPFILLYRHPAAVLRSHARQPGMQAVAGLIEPAVFGWGADEAAALSPGTHLPRVLECYYESFLQMARADPRSLLISYETGMMEAATAIANFTAVPLSEDHLERMKARCGFHAKNSEEIFRDAPVEHSSDNCPPGCIARYEQLERLRISPAGKR